MRRRSRLTRLPLGESLHGNDPPGDAGRAQAFRKHGLGDGRRPPLGDGEAGGGGADPQQRHQHHRAPPAKAGARRHRQGYRRSQPQRRLRRQGEIDSDAGAESDRQPKHPTLPLDSQRFRHRLDEPGDTATAHGEALVPERRSRHLRTLFPHPRPDYATSLAPVAAAPFIGLNFIRSGHDRRYPFRSFTHRLPSPRRCPHGSFQLAFRQAPWRKVPSPHRGHRPGAIHGPGRRGHP